MVSRAAVRLTRTPMGRTAVGRTIRVDSCVAIHLFRENGHVCRVGERRQQKHGCVCIV